QFLNPSCSMIILDEFSTRNFFGSWSGVIFRSVSPRYARAADIISGYESYCAGGRWNAPGIYAIYGSIEPGSRSGGRCYGRRVRQWDADGLALEDQLMASYGPAMEVYGHYSRVSNPDGSDGDLDRYLTGQRTKL